MQFESLSFFQIVDSIFNVQLTHFLPILNLSSHLKMVAIPEMFPHAFCSISTHTFFVFVISRPHNKSSKLCCPIVINLTGYVQYSLLFFTKHCLILNPCFFICHRNLNKTLSIFFKKAPEIIIGNNWNKNNNFCSIFILTAFTLPIGVNGKIFHLTKSFFISIINFP